MLQMRKVVEHVCEKIIVNVIEENVSSTCGAAQEAVNTLKGLQSTSDIGTFPVDKVELYCNDQKLDEGLDLRTVKHYIWKTSGDLILHYMPLK